MSVPPAPILPTAEAARQHWASTQMAAQKPRSDREAPCPALTPSPACTTQLLPVPLPNVQLPHGWLPQFPLAGLCWLRALTCAPQLCSRRTDKVG